MNNRSTVTSQFGVQKIGKQRSPVLPKEKDIGVNLRDRLNDVLLSEKHIIDGYQIGMNEVIDEQLYNIVMQNLDRNRQLQRKMFEQLFDLGEYQADTATPPQISDALDMFTNYKTQLPYQQNQQNQ